ncbi:ABC transporter ATP-binding protein [uncultured Clostridium sp.]|uniref:ABC transporter ATP-binding protein n=1 Tax=uncultured Clostridium sp. TaxID=59620 RepID=UPI00262B96C1|nr:ABC transporter ATP-binding protein [uncultured Clostridium sp.]
MKKVIQVKDLCKNYEFYKKKQGLQGTLKNLFKREMLKKEAVKDISFSIEEGEIVAFLGPNGAGKTTTLKMLSGILFPTSGSIKILGFNPSKRENKFKEKISIVMGQKNQLWWDLPSIESFYLIKKIYNISDEDYKERLDQMAELLDVTHLLEVQVRRLSLGERMKMEIIAALLHNPKVLFLDEPTIGLDIVSQKKIREFLRYYNRKEKTTIILTSHYMEDIKSLCERCIVIAKGKVVFDDKLESLGSLDNTKILKIKLADLEKKNLLESYGKILEIKDIEVSLEVEKESLKFTVSEIFEKFNVIDFTIEDTPIENSIENLYKLGC